MEELLKKILEELKSQSDRSKIAELEKKLDALSKRLEELERRPIYYPNIYYYPWYTPTAPTYPTWTFTTTGNSVGVEGTIGSSTVKSPIDANSVYAHMAHGTPCPVQPLSDYEVRWTPKDDEE